MKKPNQKNYEATKLSGGLSLWIEPYAMHEVATVYGPHQTSAMYRLYTCVYNDKSSGPGYTAEGTRGGAKSFEEARGRAMKICREHIKRKVAEQLYKKAILKIVSQLVST